MSVYSEKKPNGKVTVFDPQRRSKTPAKELERSNGAVYLSATHVELYSFDDKYMERLQGKDPLTEHHFYDYFGTLLRIKLRSRKLPRCVIEDVQQETFRRVLDAVCNRTVQQPDRLGPYVNSVCNHVLLEHYRQLVREQHVDLEAADGPDGNADLEAQAIAEEKGIRVRETLNTLSERDQAVLSAVLLDRDKDEVCRELKINREYLRVLIHRAMENFRDRYRGRGFASSKKQNN